MFVIAELVDGEKYAAVNDSEEDCDLGGGVKSREPTSGDPCCRGSPKCTYMSPRVTSFGDGSSLGQPAQGHEAVHSLDLELAARAEMKQTG
jgi:hypothetical protein